MLDERWTRPVPPAEVERALAGRRIEAVERRGKYLLLRPGRRPDAGDAPADDRQPAARRARRIGGLARRARAHLRAVDLGLERRRARCCSPTPAGSARRWSWSGDELDDYFAARLGVEPLSEELTAEELCRLAAGRRAPLKSFLLNQSGIAGIGNIYADEALHRAALHPLSPAGSMKPEDCERLREGIVATLEAGLRSGGASIDDYLDARGERGSMQDEFLVHTREGEPCPRCGARDPEDRRGRPLDLLLPRLPASPAPPAPAARAPAGLPA